MSITDRDPNRNVLRKHSYIHRVPVFFRKEIRKTPPQSNRCNPITMAEGWRFRPHPPPPPIDEDSRLDTVRLVLYGKR